VANKKRATWWGSRSLRFCRAVPHKAGSRAAENWLAKETAVRRFVGIYNCEVANSVLSTVLDEDGFGAVRRGVITHRLGNWADAVWKGEGENDSLG